jgi:hypothetical protein
MSKNKFGKPHNAFFGSLEHHGSKKLSQQGAEFFHKIHEVRKRPTPGFRGEKQAVGGPGVGGVQIYH